MMMKRSKIVLVWLLLACLLPASAQKKKTTAKKVVKVEAPAENPRLTEMLQNTQRVLFFDSVVVERAQLLSAIYTNPEEGRLSTYTDFFHAPGQQTDVVYINELGNKCVFSMRDAEGRLRLYTCDMLGNEWSTPELLKGLEDADLGDMGYPYLMPDGQTLYFAARGGNALGGYDIYHTRLDVGSGRFLKPENVGMPFNSEADDLLYVVSEQDSIGFFATNRRQPEGMVCVYAFVPSKSHTVYDINSLGDERVRRLAAIFQISDTWENKGRQAAAMARLQHLKAQAVASKPVGTPKDYFVFEIDDHTTYHQLSDFRDADNANRMRELLSMKKLYADLAASLEKDRNDYEQGSVPARNRLRNDILQQEEQMHQLAQQIRFLEKEIRNNELSNQ